MIQIWLRSLLFNILFFGLSTLLCLAIVPFVFSGKKTALVMTRIFTRKVYWLERNILNLNYEVRGREHLPKDGAYIIAAKHQSAYETMKLHALFGDPAIILKRELTRIPIWGKFLQNLDMIDIDRSNREEAMESIVSGTRRMAAQGRPIVIFPQGTRVHVSKTAAEKPYKGGIIKMYNATDLPVIPLAMNSGMFWGRNSFLKYPGTVVFEFLPPIEPGLPDKKVIKALEERIERASIRLMNEAKAKDTRLAHIKTPPDYEEVLL